MNRTDFIKTLALFPIAGAVLPLNCLNKLADGLDESPEMPVLFVGHGSPMNAIEENEFVKGFREMAATLPRPKAILCISAHWETQGTYVTSMRQPKTIHDFGGFPEALYQQQYPAPGDPILANEIQAMIHKTPVNADLNWGLDHGAWTVLKHFYPYADIPVVQCSLDYTKDPQFHYDLAAELMPLRKRGILIIGSGNMVHNLGRLDWNRLNEVGYAYDWAAEASEKMKKSMITGDHASLIRYREQGKAFHLAIPSPEHYLPLLYVLGLQRKDERLTLFNDRALAGSLTMTSVRIG